MRIVFLGTSSFAVPCLRALIESENDVLCVVSRPPKPAGRGKKLRQPPLAVYAAEHDLPIHQPLKLTSDFIETLKSLDPDIMISAAYGAWLPEKLLRLTTLGVVNVHPSFLPEYRGAAPIIRAILDGRTETAVSFMLTDSGWDTGPIISVHPERILPNDTAGSLEERLAESAANNIVEIIERYSEGILIPRAQEGQEIYAEKITTDETWLDWNTSAENLERKVRAFQPAPGARTMYSGRLLKISAAKVPESRSEPGVVVLRNDSFLVGCGGKQSLEILRLQPASKSIMSAAEFLRGARMKTGDKLGKG